MTQITEYYDIQLANDSLPDAEGFICGTEYEIEDVQYISLPGHDKMNRGNLSLSDSSAYWVGNIGLMHDGSLRNGGVEFITKPLTFKESLNTFGVLHKGLTLGPQPFSSRTSIHVHVNMTNMSMAQLKHFLLCYALLEPVFFEVAGETRKHNIHCVPLNFTILPSIYSKPIQDIVKAWSKYSAFNLMPIKTQGTVEFRHLYGTADAQVYQKWLTLIKELWDFVYNNHVTMLEQLLRDGNSPQYIQNIVLPSSKYMSPDYSASFIDVKLAF
jgi:Putative amidoligase enzyme